MHIALDNKNSIAVRRTVRICFALAGGMGVCSHLWGSSPPNAVLYSARWTSRGTLFISFSDVSYLALGLPPKYRPTRLCMHAFMRLWPGAVNRSRVIVARVYRTHRVFFSSSSFRHHNRFGGLYVAVRGFSCYALRLGVRLSVSHVAYLHATVACSYLLRW